MPFSREQLLTEGRCKRRFKVRTLAERCTRDDVQPADADLLGPGLLQIEAPASADVLPVPHRLLEPQRQPHIDRFSDPDSRELLRPDADNCERDVVHGHRLTKCLASACKRSPPESIADDGYRPDTRQPVVVLLEGTAHRE